MVWDTLSPFPEALHLGPLSRRAGVLCAPVLFCCLERTTSAGVRGRPHGGRLLCCGSYHAAVTNINEVLETRDLTEELQDLETDSESSTPHLDKLQKLLSNKKLPADDRPRVEEAVERYKIWKKTCKESELEGDELLMLFVDELNKYRRYIEYDLIWMSETEFIYRSKGQLKLDNSIIEEFLPMLMDKRIIPQLKGIGFETGPKKSFSSLYILNSINNISRGIKLAIRTKDQDFTLGRRMYLRASVNNDFSGNTEDFPVYLAFVAAECKTNLDKTMFQEAVSTSHDLKTSIPGSKYFVICDWLDMKPISTKGTDIDEVLILRGKRVGSGDRKENSSPEYRKDNAETYATFLDSHPVRYEVIKRFVGHVAEHLTVIKEDTATAAERGYF